MSCKQGLKTITVQITDMLERIPQEDYAQPLTVFNGSTLGQHFRHILDFYQCLIRGLENGVVDYAHRERDPAMETEPRFAAAAFRMALSSIETMDEQAPVLMRADFLHTGEEERPVFRSSFGRELTFVHDHAIHHMAMIKIGVHACCPQILDKEQFGVAPSTIRFRMNQ